MNKLFLTLLFLLFSSIAYSTCSDRPVVVAVIDTGFYFEGKGMGAHLCSSGHRDFTVKQYGPAESIPLDTIGHGTNITGIIEEYASKTHVNYCIVVLKYYTSYNNNDNIKNSIAAFNYAADIKADFINYSSGGYDPYPKEKDAIERYLDGGGHLVVAAGNDHKNSDAPGNNGWYPAKYDKRIVVVGALDSYGNKAYFSNYGSIVNDWEPGVSITGFGITMSRTSQATAIKTGKLVSQSQNKCDRIQ